MKINPKISVVIPTFNRAKLITRALESIKKQTYSNWECLIVDDLSSDNTTEVVTEYVNSDERFKLIKNKNKKGAPGARNTGLQACEGDIVYFFDSDNTLYPDAIEKMTHHLVESGADICTCFANVVDEKGNKVGVFDWVANGNIRSKLLFGGTYVDYNISIIKKEALKNFKGMDEECPSYQEWDTHIRLSANNSYTTLEEYLVDYFKGAEDAISSNILKSISGFLYVLKKHRALFIEDLSGFRKMGLQLLKTSKMSNDARNHEMLSNDLDQLIPGFKSYKLKDRFSKTLGKIKHKIKALRDN